MPPRSRGWPRGRRRRRAGPRSGPIRPSSRCRRRWGRSPRARGRAPRAARRPRSGPGGPRRARGQVFGPVLTASFPDAQRSLNFRQRKHAGTLTESISKGTRVHNGGVTEAHVLVVDDEPMVREVLARYLAREGFGVETAEDGESALAAFDRTPPDLVLLDLMLPRIDGLELFRLMRERGPAAVIMLTAKGEETDRVVGLELGADDYVTKPFSPRGLTARVKAVLRRASGPLDAPPTSAALRAGDLEVDLVAHEVRLAGELVALTA